MPRITLHNASFAVVGTADVPGPLDATPVVKLRFAGDCSTAPAAPPLDRERWYARRGHTSAYDEVTDKMTFLSPHEVTGVDGKPLAAEPPAGACGAYGLNWAEECRATAEDSKLLAAARADVDSAMTLMLSGVGVPPEAFRGGAEAGGITKASFDQAVAAMKAKGGKR